MLFQKYVIYVLYFYHSTAKSEEEPKSLLMRVKEESEKAGLKLNIKKLRLWHLVQSFHSKQKGKK